MSLLLPIPGVKEEKRRLFIVYGWVKKNSPAEGGVGR